MEEEMDMVLKRIQMSQIMLGSSRKIRKTDKEQKRIRTAHIMLAISRKTRNMDRELLH